jgi:hypothetical protein
MPETRGCLCRVPSSRRSTTSRTFPRSGGPRTCLPCRRKRLPRCRSRSGPTRSWLVSVAHFAFRLVLSVKDLPHQSRRRSKMGGGGNGCQDVEAGAGETLPGLYVKFQSARSSEEKVATPSSTSAFLAGESSGTALSIVFRFLLLKESP